MQRHSCLYTTCTCNMCMHMCMCMTCTCACACHMCMSCACACASCTCTPHTGLTLGCSVPDPEFQSPHSTVPTLQDPKPWPKPWPKASPQGCTATSLLQTHTPCVADIAHAVRCAGFLLQVRSMYSHCLGTTGFLRRQREQQGHFHPLSLVDWLKLFDNATSAGKPKGAGQYCYYNPVRPVAQCWRGCRTAGGIRQ